MNVGGKWGPERESLIKFLQQPRGRAEVSLDLSAFVVPKVKIPIKLMDTAILNVRTGSILKFGRFGKILLILVRNLRPKEDKLI